MKYLFEAVLFGVLFISCKHKDEKATSSYISVVSLIKAQVAHIDTSLYPIIKIISYDSLHQDTTYIPREEFANEAKDFLTIPDLSDKKVAKRYKQDPPRYDELIGRVIFKYTPVDYDKEEVKSQEFLATPVPGQDAKINNVIITREISNRDSFLQKKMLWKMDKSFQVVTTSQKKGKPEVTTITRVIWNEDPYQ
ncbi:MAG TPA: hypothetical protein VMZ03_10695 [Chitinophagaceae bacterium]|nr:hypothetical protein [Chitinophagaceae bacterium]